MQAVIERKDEIPACRRCCEEKSSASYSVVTVFYSISPVAIVILLFAAIVPEIDPIDEMGSQFYLHHRFNYNC